MERLDKIIASQGFGSRKDVKSLISKGHVQVNGVTAKNSDCKINNSDIISINGKEINVQKFIYLMLNKPQGYVCAVKDPIDKTVLDLVPAKYQRKNLFPAGRLDKDTTGLLIITDDGVLAHEILSPKKHVSKNYIVSIDIPMTDTMIKNFSDGVQLNDSKCKPAKLEIISQYTGKVTLQEGKYHQIKRMFGCCGAKVTSLKRISMGALMIDESLPLGDCRPLTEQELVLLQIKS